MEEKIIMKEGVKYTGVPSVGELNNCTGIPSQERMAKGPVAFIECVQCIPCNPCEMACPTKAISIGEPITNIPILDEDRCTGCGDCIAHCPGHAISVINKAYGNGKATMDFPFEYYPLPKVGDIVEAVDRYGQTSCDAKVLSVCVRSENNGTNVIRIEYPLSMSGNVKSIRHLKAEV